MEKIVNLPLTDIEKKFWINVIMIPFHDCWEWTHTVSNSGYGVFYGKFSGFSMQAMAHKLSYFLANGPIPEGMVICHRCDNKLCVRPDHLFLGTQMDNTRDKVSKNRHSAGESHGCHKLTLAQVNEIRAKYTGAYGEGRKLAREYNISPAMISHIVTKHSWKLNR